MNTEQLTSAFTSYRTVLSEKPPFDQAQYGWEKIPDSLPIEAFGYQWILSTHTTNVANEINQFGVGIRRLEAWGEVLQRYETIEKMALLVEFINPLATLVLGFPALIRDRVIFAATLLCHQANRILPGWHDNIEPDHRIKLPVLKQRAHPWGAGSSLVERLAALNDTEYRNSTREFRNRFHHRDSPRIEVGISATITKIDSTPGRTMHAMGYAEPLQISDVLAPLWRQHAVSLDVFKGLQELVWEHLAAMTKTQEQRT